MLAIFTLNLTIMHFTGATTKGPLGGGQRLWEEGAFLEVGVLLSNPQHVVLFIKQIFAKKLIEYAPSEYLTFT
jgi:hypothetical protein